MKNQEAKYRELLGKSLLALAHERLGENAKLSQMAMFVSQRVGITEEEAKLLMFQAS